MAEQKVYDNEFKIQAVKLGRKIGFSKAVKELGGNIDTYSCFSQYLSIASTIMLFTVSFVVPLI